MKPTIEQQYLLDYLAEEFRCYPEVRIRMVPYQSGEPEEFGIEVKTESREYFFYFHWLDGRRFGEVTKLVTRIKEALPDR
jgi:hypothetical protein